jgi:hypothetical protein
MIRAVGAYPADGHQLASRNGDGVHKPVKVPALEKGHVQTDVGGSKIFFSGSAAEEARKVFDAIHFDLVSGKENRRHKPKTVTKGYNSF